MLLLAVPAAVSVVVVVLQEKVLVQAVACEGDDGDAEAGDRVLEPVPPAEAARVAPGFAGGLLDTGMAWTWTWWSWVVMGADVCWWWVGRGEGGRRVLGDGEVWDGN